MTIRPLLASDSIREMTALVHASYKQLADMGFRYWGTWQSEDDTVQRCGEGHCLVAVKDDRLVGTVTAKQSKDDGDPEWYLQEGVWVVTQFGVLPSLQGEGLGSRLLVEAERHAFSQGGLEVAIDTAEGATHLIDYYAKRGFRRVGSVDWGGTNYVSVVMSKRIRPLLTTQRLVLRDLVHDDIATIAGHWADPRFAALFPPGRMTEVHCREVFEPEIERLSEYPRRGHHWAIETGGRMIGTIRLSFERSETGSVGYGLCADHWGKGIATEALREVVRYAFEECGLHRLQAFVFSPNLGSMNVLRKCGFVHEGAFRERVRWGDGRVDDEIFGLLRTEWLATTTR